MKNEKSNLVKAIIIMHLKRGGLKISTLTEKWLMFAKQYKIHLSHLTAFERQFEMYVTAEVSQKIAWIFAVLLFAPVVASVDAASLHLFFQFMGSRTGGTLRSVLADYGFAVFFILELAICSFYLHARKKYDQGEGSKSFMIFFILLMFILAIIPSGVIAAGYMLQPTKALSDLIKICTLTVFSLAVHVAIFLSAELLLDAFGFLVYLYKLTLFAVTNPKAKLIKLTPELRKEHIKYQHYENEFWALPADQQLGFDPSLGRRESWLRDKLNGFNDEDFDVDTIYSASESTPPNKPDKGGAAVIPTDENKSGSETHSTD